MSNSRSRFAVTLPTDALEGVQAMVIGCGGIGGYTALLLAKMGVQRLCLIDHDKVEEVNVGTQIYGRGSVGKYKVKELASLLREHTPVIYDETHVMKFHPDLLGLFTAPRRLIITALDSIEARREVWDVVYTTMADGDTLYVDPRMTLESLEVNALSIGAMYPSSAKVRLAYDNRIKDTSQVYEEQPCGEQSMPGTGMFAASVIMSIVLRWLVRERFPHLILGTLDCSTTASPYMNAYYPEMAGIPKGPLVGLGESGVWNRKTGERIRPKQ